MATVQDRTHAVNGLNDPQQGARSGPQAVAQYRDRLFGAHVRAGTAPFPRRARRGVARPSDRQPEPRSVRKINNLFLTERNAVSEAGPGAGRPGRHDPNRWCRDRCEHVSVLPGLAAAA
jgi:hypothetical protein